MRLSHRTLKGLAWLMRALWHLRGILGHCIFDSIICIHFATYTWVNSLDLLICCWYVLR